MMNLQGARMVTSGQAGTSGNQTVSLVQFGRVVGSIGEPLEQSMAERDLYFRDDDDDGLEHLQGEGPSRSSVPA